jgi:hypothetical protein
VIAIYAGTLYTRASLFLRPPLLSSLLLFQWCSHPLHLSTPLSLALSHTLLLSLTIYPLLSFTPHPLRQVHTPQDHDRRTTTPYRRCTPARTSPNQQIYPALYRRPRSLHDTFGLLPRTLAGFNQGRRKKISREIRYFWVSLCSLYSVFLFFSTLLFL